MLKGDYKDQIKDVIIVDSRYPYEYEGGHISTALNIYTKEKLYDEMFIKRCNKPINQLAVNSEANSGKRSIIIFHCEFSSERGPSL